MSGKETNRGKRKEKRREEGGRIRGRKLDGSDNKIEITSRPKRQDFKKGLNLEDETPDSSSSEKPAQEIAPVTKETKKALQQWTSNTGEVGVTNCAIEARHMHPELITAVFGLMSEQNTLITYDAREEEIYGLTPHNREHKPRKGIRYLCKRPWPEAEPLFYTKNRPVYIVRVYPLIVRQVNERVISLTLDDPEAVITEELISHAAFGKDAVLYIENGECMYVWIKNPKYIGKVETVLSEAEKMEQGGMLNPWQKNGGNLLKAPVYAMSPESIAQLVAWAIQQKEEKLLPKNELTN